MGFHIKGKCKRSSIFRKTNYTCNWRIVLTPLPEADGISFLVHGFMGAEKMTFTSLVAASTRVSPLANGSSFTT
jgi:hypothetical protein